MQNWVINVAGSQEKQKEILCSYVISCLPSKLRKVAATDPHYTATIPVFGPAVDSVSLKATAEELVSLLSNAAEIFADKKPNIELSENNEVVVKAPTYDIDLKRWIKQLSSPAATIFNCDKTLNTCLSNISQLDLSNFGNANVSGTEKIELPKQTHYAQVSNCR